MDTKKYIVNVEAAIKKGDNWLLVKRSDAEEHAAGAISLVGGKVEGTDITNNTLEETLRREILEEVGVEVHKEMMYVKSSLFITDNGEAVVDVVFLCEHKSGEPAALQPEEIAEVMWMNEANISESDNIAEWTKESIKIAATKSQTPN